MWETAPGTGGTLVVLVLTPEYIAIHTPHTTSSYTAVANRVLPSLVSLVSRLSRLSRLSPLSSLFYVSYVLSPIKLL